MFLVILLLLLVSGAEGDCNGYTVYGNCTNCPKAAVCDGSTYPKTSAGYWGIVSDPANFYRCPRGYCSNVVTNVENCCNLNRTGILCGKCAEGYSVAISGTNCHSDADCQNDALLWVFIVVLSGFVALVLVFGGISSYNAHGYFKIAAFFYHVAPFTVSGVKKLQIILSIIFDLFNLHLNSSGYSLVDICAFDGADIFGKKMFWISVPCFIFLWIGVFSILQKSWEGIKVFPVAGNGMFYSSANNWRQRHWQALCVAMELGYMNLIRICMELLQCVSISESGSRLYLDANVACYSWQQGLIILFLIVLCSWPVILIAAERLGWTNVPPLRHLGSVFRAGMGYWDTVVIIRKLLIVIPYYCLQYSPLYQSWIVACICIGSAVHSAFMQPWVSINHQRVDVLFLSFLGILSVRGAGSNEAKAFAVSEQDLTGDYESTAWIETILLIVPIAIILALSAPSFETLRALPSRASRSASRAIKSRSSNRDGLSSQAWFSASLSLEIAAPIPDLENIADQLIRKILVRRNLKNCLTIDNGKLGTKKIDRIKEIVSIAQSHWEKNTLVSLMLTISDPTSNSELETWNLSVRPCERSVTVATQILDDQLEASVQDLQPIPFASLSDLMLSFKGEIPVMQISITGSKDSLSTTIEHAICSIMSARGICADSWFASPDVVGMAVVPMVALHQELRNQMTQIKNALINGWNVEFFPVVIISVCGESGEESERWVIQTKSIIESMDLKKSIKWVTKQVQILTVGIQHVPSYPYYHFEVENPPPPSAPTQSDSNVEPSAKRSKSNYNDIFSEQEEEESNRSKFIRVSPVLKIDPTALLEELDPDAQVRLFPHTRTHAVYMGGLSEFGTKRYQKPEAKKTIRPAAAETLARRYPTLLHAYQQKKVNQSTESSDEKQAEEASEEPTDISHEQQFEQKLEEQEEPTTPPPPPPTTKEEEEEASATTEENMDAPISPEAIMNRYITKKRLVETIGQKKEIQKTISKYALASTSINSAIEDVLAISTDGNSSSQELSNVAASPPSPRPVPPLKARYMVKRSPSLQQQQQQQLQADILIQPLSSVITEQYFE